MMSLMVIMQSYIYSLLIELRGSLRGWSINRQLFSYFQNLDKMDVIYTIR